MNENITKEGVVVESGQVWRSLDAREDGRHVLIVSVASGKAAAQRCTPDGRVVSPKATTLSISRMRKGSTGWSLVHGTNGKVTTVAPIKTTVTREQLAQCCVEE